MTQIITMKPEDYDEVRAMWETEPLMFLDPISDSREGITRYLERNPTTSFIARDGELVVGAIIAGHDGRKGIFHQAMVREGYRGRGIGTALKEAAMNALSEVGGLTKVFFTMPEGNDEGEEFWMKRGFEKRQRENNFVQML